MNQYRDAFLWGIITVMHYRYNALTWSIKRVMWQVGVIYWKYFTRMLQGMMCWEVVWWLGDALRCSVMNGWCMGDICNVWCVSWMNEWMNDWIFIWRINTIYTLGQGFVVRTRTRLQTVLFILVSSSRYNIVVILINCYTITLIYCYRGKDNADFYTSG